MPRVTKKAVAKDLTSKAEKHAQKLLDEGKEYKPRSESGRKALEKIKERGAKTKEKETAKVDVPKIVEKFEPKMTEHSYELNQFGYNIPLRKTEHFEYTVPLRYIKDHHHLAGYIAGPSSVHGNASDLYAVGASESTLEPVESKEIKFIKDSNKMFMAEQRPAPRIRYDEPSSYFTQHPYSHSYKFPSKEKDLERAIGKHYETAEPEVPHEISRLEREPESMQSRPFMTEGVARPATAEYGQVRHRATEVDPELEAERGSAIRNQYANNIMHNRFGAAEQLQDAFPSAARTYELLDNAPIKVSTITANPSENIKAHSADQKIASPAEPDSWWREMLGFSTKAKEAMNEAKDAQIVSARSGDINANTISENSVYEQGLVNEQNQLLKGVLLKMNRNKAGDGLPQHITFDEWQDMVNTRFGEALQLQIDKAIRDEEIMDLSQKNRILERNALFNQMYFTPMVA